MLDLEKYILNLSGSGWLLHPHSLHTIKHVGTAYLARPGFAGLIEVQQKDKLSGSPFFVQRLEMPLVPEHLKLVRSLGAEGIVPSEDKKIWLQCGDIRFCANDLWS